MNNHYWAKQKIIIMSVNDVIRKIVPIYNFSNANT